MKRASRNLLCALSIGLAAGSGAAQTQRSANSLVPPAPRIQQVERLARDAAGGNRIIGSAIDSRGLPISKAHLQLRNLQNGQIVLQSETSDVGEYSFGLVESGTYVVELNPNGAVIALSDAVTLGGGELVQTVIQVPGRWDPASRSVVLEPSLAQFLGASAADTMAGETMTHAASQGITSVDAGEPVSGGR